MKLLQSHPTVLRLSIMRRMMRSDLQAGGSCLWSRWHRVSGVVPLAVGLIGALASLLLVREIEAAETAPVSVEISTVESNRYDVGLRLFRDGAYNLASEELGAFVQGNRESAQAVEAVLYQAQAEFQLGRYGRSLELLREFLPQSGAQEEAYRFWIAQALLEAGEHPQSAEAFANFLKAYPESAFRLEACVGEAFAYYRAGDLRRTVDALANPEGAFSRMSQRKPESEWVVRGRLLQAEASLALGDLVGGVAALNSLDDEKISRRYRWEKQVLMARLEMARENTEAVLVATTNLFNQIVGVTNQLAAEFKAEAVALRGKVLELRKDFAGAVAAYERNLEAPVSQAYRLEAVQAIARLTVDAHQTEEAIARLEEYIRQYPNDQAVDLIRVTLGELLLRRQATLPVELSANASNLLAQAQAQFQMVVTNRNSKYRAQAFLGEGWVNWTEGLTDRSRLPDAIGAFRQATELLPVSKEQAVSRFKLGDCYYVLTNYPPAITNYWIVATNYNQLPLVAESLVPRALHQIVRAGIASDDMAQATRAMQQVLEDHTESPFSDRSMLLYGQALHQQGKPTDARTLYAQFIKRFPGSPRIAEVELELARTYQKEGDWQSAIGEYDRWVTNHPGHALLPRAEFDRAWSYYLGGRDSDSYGLFANLLTRFPKDSLAAWAQDWVAGYEFRRGRFDQAELGYKRVYQNTNWNAPTLTYQAQLMAGRSAFFRQGYNDARGYFTNLLNDPNCPGNLLPEVYFELGNTIMANNLQNGTNTVRRYTEAITAFSKIPQTFPQSEYVPLAWGQMGNCHLQLRQYAKALEAFTNVLGNERSDVAARSQARVGSALVYERMAEGKEGPERNQRLNDALRQYLYVVDGLDLRPSETIDPFWLKEAALGAALVAEELKEVEVSRNLYRRLIELAPSMQPLWEARLNRLAAPPIEGIRPVGG